MSDEAQNPGTASEALELWDKGKPLRAFRVNSDGIAQDKIYAAAFEILRHWDDWNATAIKGAVAFRAVSKDLAHLTGKEFDSAYSIAHVARLRGWSRMVDEHIGERSPEISVRSGA